MLTKSPPDASSTSAKTGPGGAPVLGRVRERLGHGSADGIYGASMPIGDVVAHGNGGGGAWPGLLEAACSRTEYGAQAAVVLIVPEQVGAQVTLLVSGQLGDFR
jgi:hypothetical protein